MLSTRTPEERRLPILTFRAYATPENDFVELATPEGRATASLIDFTSTGARVKTRQAAGAREGDVVDFNIRLLSRGLETGAVPCTVIWATDNEIEVRFPGSPAFTVGEMQGILDQ